MPKLTKDCLSEKDQLVLDSIFNPLQVGGGSELEKWNLIDGDDKEEEDHNSYRELSDEEKESIKLELEAIKFAEIEKDYQKSIELLTQAINLTPSRAEAYNNRAQAYRFLGDSDNLAFADIEKALELSNSSGKTGCRAFCQRGVLYRKLEKDDEAREDFKKAAELGSKFAKNQLIELNPYAALCNQMLREAFTKLG